MRWTSCIFDKSSRCFWSSNFQPPLLRNEILRRAVYNLGRRGDELTMQLTMRRCHNADILALKFFWLVSSIGTMTGGQCYPLRRVQLWVILWAGSLHVFRYCINVAPMRRQLTEDNVLSIKVFWQKLTNSSKCNLQKMIHE